MIDREQAIEMVRKYLQEEGQKWNKSLALFENQTMELEFGWVFFYSTKQHVETGDFRFGFPGNAPIIVDKDDASIHETGTDRTIDQYIEEYRNLRRSRSH